MYLIEKLKIMVVKMLTKLERRMDEYGENINKDRKIKKVANGSFTRTEKYTKDVEQLTG